MCHGLLKEMQQQKAMDSKCFFTFVLVSLFTGSDGINAYECGKGKTLFVPEKSTAIFQTLFSIFSPIRFLKIHPTYERLFKLNRSTLNGSEEHLVVYNEDLLDSVDIGVSEVTNDMSEVRIQLKDIRMTDNGTYILLADTQTCFDLFVMSIEMKPSAALEENEPAIIYAHPHASIIKRPQTNATMIWLLNGISVDHIAYFIIYEEYLWISHVKKEFNEKIITYRAIQDNGNYIDVSYMLNVRYGPSLPLNLTPGHQHYSLVSGNLMPDIRCSCECYPPCNISWERYSTGNILSLGTVTTDESGEYTCTASNMGGKTVKQTISVFVYDDPTFTLKVLTSLVAIQIVVTLAISFCVFLIWKRRKSLHCCTWSSKTKDQPQNASGNCTNATTMWL